MATLFEPKKNWAKSGCHTLLKVSCMNDYSRFVSKPYDSQESCDYWYLQDLVSYSKRHPRFLQDLS